MWFISNKLTSRFSITKIREKFLGWFVGIAELSSLGNLFSTKKTVKHDWQDRMQEEARLVAAAKEAPLTMTLLYGPRGSGKTDLIDKVKQNIKYSIIIY